MSTISNRIFIKEFFILQLTYNFNKGNYDQLNAELEYILWDVVLSNSSNIEEMT